MPRATQSAHPLQTLRDLTTALEAAVLECLARPGKEAVHHLRTTTRRIEAQLELLAQLPHQPPQPKPRDKALKLLGKLRKSAGRVRDLDVQRDLIQQTAAGRPTLRRDARQLRKFLQHQREAEAATLASLLHKHQRDLPKTFAKLLDSLAAVESIALPEPRLITLIQDWYSTHAAICPDGHATAGGNLTDTARLHDIRKKAKLARYLAESAPESATRAHRLAAKFESLQKAGGEWHDWLLLSQIAADELGPSAPLVTRIQRNTEKTLAAYQRRLSKPAAA